MLRISLILDQEHINSFGHELSCGGDDQGITQLGLYKNCERTRYVSICRTALPLVIRLLANNHNKKIYIILLCWFFGAICGALPTGVQSTAWSLAVRRELGHYRWKRHPYVCLRVYVLFLQTLFHINARVNHIYRCWQNIAYRWNIRSYWESKPRTSGYMLWRNYWEQQRKI